ncbi:MAG: hypothetical protein V3Q69_10740 [Burkholderia sp.]
MCVNINGSRSIYATTPSHCLIFPKKMRKDIHKTGKPKARYRVRNWVAYNKSLINRENVTIWIDEAVLARIPDAIPTVWSPVSIRRYADSDII